MAQSGPALFFETISSYQRTEGFVQQLNLICSLSWQLVTVQLMNWGWHVDPSHGGCAS